MGINKDMIRAHAATFKRAMSGTDLNLKADMAAASKVAAADAAAGRQRAAELLLPRSLSDVDAAAASPATGMALEVRDAPPPSFALNVDFLLKTDHFPRQAQHECT
jgi:hypothetical protein